jgi:hypothetical protein
LRFLRFLLRWWCGGLLALFLTILIFFFSHTLPFRELTTQNQLLAASPPSSRDQVGRRVSSADFSTLIFSSSASASDLIFSNSAFFSAWTFSYFST